MSSLDYPPARIDHGALETTEVGLKFSDPYHWLEANSDETYRWKSQQNDLAAESIGAWPHLSALRKSVEYFAVDPIEKVPHCAGGLWFREERQPGATQASVVVSKSPFGTGRVLFDPDLERPDHPPFLSWLAPSPDGRVLAVGVCVDGSERNTIRLIDVATGQYLPHAPAQVLQDAWTGGVCWLPDSSAFFFLALVDDFYSGEQQLFLHDLATSSQMPVDIDLPGESALYIQVTASPQERYLVAHFNMKEPRPVAFFDLQHKQQGWQSFIMDVDGGILYGHIVEDHYIAITDVDAPNGRVVSIPLGAHSPEDPACWTELVAESEAVQRSLTPVGHHLYLSELIDTYSRVRIIELNGNIKGEVPLPGNGVVSEQPIKTMQLVSRGYLDEYLFPFSTPTQSWGVYSHRPGADTIETLKPPEVAIENTIVEDAWSVSADGTRIPYHSICLADRDLSCPQPTLIYIYGGLNVAFLPQFPSRGIAAFVAAGGTLVLGHLRGGGEMGRRWWEGGRMLNKKNCYQDLYSIAEHLVEKGLASPDTLAVTGGSNGGLATCVAITQRPELWRAAVSRMPLLDLIGALREPSFARAVMETEFCDPTTEDEIRRLASFSPYHMVQDGEIYPALYIDAGDADLRCRPWHSHKFAARLQAASGGQAPILVRTWDNVGHGWATAKDVEIKEFTEWLAFLMRELGMEPQVTL